MSNRGKALPIFFLLFMVSAGPLSGGPLPAQPPGMSPGAIVTPNGPYYGKAPEKETQASRVYTEAPATSPEADYEAGSRLLWAFRQDLARRAAKRGPLSGWKIVVDPGHGGRDPGAIVSNVDGREQEVHVVEDEYVYDIALRVFEGLTLLGADLELTVISPNHLLRENTPATATFVHEQNEVYNDRRLNRRRDDGVRPSRANVGERVKIANRLFRGGRRGKRLFVSLHADNSPGRPKGPLVIYSEVRGRKDGPSARLAERMQRALSTSGAPGQSGGRSLAVLRDNHADAEILIEIRNVHFVGDAWALRYHERRQEDADRVVRGIEAWAKSK